MCLNCKQNTLNTMFLEKNIGIGVKMYLQFTFSLQVLYINIYIYIASRGNAIAFMIFLP